MNLTRLPCTGSAMSDGPAAHDLAPGPEPEASPTPAEDVVVALPGPALTSPVGAPTPPPPSRPLFQEASRLGLLVAGATVGGPLGEILSQEARTDLLALLREVEAAGLGFAHHPNPNADILSGTGPRTPEQVAERILESRGQFGHACLNVSIKPPPPRALGYGDVPMRMARVTSFSDLAALEALALRHDPTGLPDAAMATTLLALERAGSKFYLDPNRTRSSGEPQGAARAVGAYGAWRALTVSDGWHDDELLYVGRSVQSSAPLRGKDGFDTIAFFELGHSSALLDRDPLACTLRDLARQGFTFHVPAKPSYLPFMGYPSAPPERDTVSAAALYLGAPTGGLEVGVRGHGLVPVTLASLADPSGPLTSLRELASWDLQHVAPRLEDGTFDDQAAGVYLEALSQPMGHLSLPQRGALLEALLEGESTSGPERLPVVVRSARAVSSVCKGADDTSAIVAELLDLRRTMRVDVALDALAWLHSVPADDPSRGKMCRVAALADSFSSAQAIVRALDGPSFDEHLSLLRAQVDFQASWGEKGILDRAFEDFKAVRDHRGPSESVSEVAERLTSLHLLVGRELSLDESRSAFEFIQDTAFPRPRSEALDRFLQAFVVSHSLEAARKAALEPPRSQDGLRVVTEDHQVTIGGVRVPRRRG